MDGITIHLQSVFIAPLLSFLTDTVVDGEDMVLTQSADHGFGDTSAGGDL